MLNCIAWADLKLATPERLDEADRLSSEAISAWHWIPECNGTRGCVLVRLGRFDEALPLLRLASRHGPQKSRALNLGYLAVAMSKLGNEFEAVRQLKLAKQLDPALQFDGLAGISQQTRGSGMPNDSLGRIEDGRATR